MSLFVIADLHLSADSDHSMEVFGSRWRDYTEKLITNWRNIVDDADAVIVPGDISWAMHLADAKSDFKLLDSLPGQKYLGKGNHDFWWETAAKMERFLDANDLRSLHFLYNNAYVLGDYIVCGTRGWFLEEEQQQTVGIVDYAKIVNREVGRLKLSLDAAVSLRKGKHLNKEILVFLHFPPVWNNFECREILDLLTAYGIRRCYHGHIHGVYHVPRTRQIDGLSLTMISADFLDFSPLRIIPDDF